MLTVGAALLIATAGAAAAHDAGAECVVRLIAADSPPGTRVPLLAQALSGGKHPERDAVLLDAMAADLTAYTARVANQFDRNQWLELLSNLELLAARHPDQVRRACGQQRDLPIRATCLAQVARGATDPTAFVDGVTATIAASPDPGYGFEEAINQSTAVLSKVAATKRDAIAAKLVELAGQLHGKFGYGVLRKMCEQMASAGEIEAAAALARLGANGTAIEGLSGAARAACKGDARPAGAALAREAATLAVTPGGDSMQVVGRMAEAASALHACRADDEARKLADAAVKAGFAESSADDRARRLADAVVIFAGAGMRDLAVSCADRMVKELPLGDPKVADALQFLARRLAWQGDVELALAVVGNLPLKSRSRALDDIVDRLLKNKQLDAALAAVRAIPEARARAFQLFKVVETCSEAGDACAGQALDELMPLLQHMPQDDSVWDYAALALGRGRRLDAALTLARSLSDPSNDGRLVKARTMTTVVEAFAKARAPQSLALANEAFGLVDPLTFFSDDRDSLLRRLVNVAVDLGDQRLARQIAERVRRPDDRKMALGQLAQHRSRTEPGDLDHLRELRDGHEKATSLLIWLDKNPSAERFVCPIARRK
jgi:hypothetical protein